MWIPLTIDPGREIRLNHVILAIGRLRPGVTLEQAQAEMDVVAARVSRQYPEMKEWGIRLVDFYHVFVSPQLQTALVVLLAAVGCVLLIASANVANLLLARAASRQKEIAVRTAMGASRARLLQQLLIESLVLSAIGGVVGVIAALWGVRCDQRADAGEPAADASVSVDAQRAALCAGVDDRDGTALRHRARVARRKDRLERGAHAGRRARRAARGRRCATALPRPNLRWRPCC